MILLIQALQNNAISIIVQMTSMFANVFNIFKSIQTQHNIITSVIAQMSKVPLV